MISRRTLVLFGATAASLSQVCGSPAGDSWNDKKSDEWSDKDVQKLMTRSPWAKEISVEFHTEGAGMGACQRKPKDFTV